ncbi:MAG: hypothetical protein HOM68_05995 [Gemmatimonadetes bacterium]|jgi:hypothetical protein|nr:hypothetical protein [Gemmatimonadota bacterium]MBT5142747.1 hypothetical protein [Gemmatimonadota bacterium]MBT5587723.1 hypothetical protein [Gemmatimonadota bacterium]MBT5960645.1 hypothetical protein [Gemmatimonadota bacterium]MBT6630438.1 hypothetical protein [Gemmatimonadota bacterium]
MNLSIEDTSILIDDSPQKLWGLRVANGTRDDAATHELIGCLDEYRSYGANAITTFFMGCRASAYDPFSADGRQIDAHHARRMQSLARACEDRGMVLVAGIFYQNAPIGMKDRCAVENAVRTATRTLDGFSNVIINVVNEHNSSGWVKHGCYPFQDPDEIIHLCRIAKQEDAARIVGAGGNDHDLNEIIGRSDHVDALLFDTIGPHSSAELSRRFRDAGIAKPLVNVEISAMWSNNEIKGVWTAAQIAHFKTEVDAAISEPALSVFFHATGWYQSLPIRYDLGGDGTAKEPGVRWYFEFLRERIQNSGV